MISTTMSSHTTIRTGEHVVVYPTFGYPIDDGDAYRIAVQGTIYAAGSISLRKRMMIRLLKRFMRVDPSEIDHDIFNSRIRGFATPTVRGRRIAVQVGGKVFPLKKASNRAGHFRGTITIHREGIEQASQDGEWLPLRVLSNDPSVDFEGRAKILQQDGVSVISDIDDTVKHSNVVSKQELLANTFLREFQFIEGMSELYNRWAEQGASFHYVSSSPWQLYEPLTELCTEGEFPEGPFHLRAFRLRDHMLRRLLLMRRPGKSKVIRRLIERFPERRFILIGDSGEKDAEIYAAMVRRFPRQIAKVYIRQLSAKPLTEQHCRKLFKKEHRGVCSLFETADELPQNVPGWTTVSSNQHDAVE